MTNQPTKLEAEIVDEVPTALEAAEKRLGVGSEEEGTNDAPQPEVAPRPGMGRMAANLWDRGCQRFAPVVRKHR